MTDDDVDLKRNHYTDEDYDPVYDYYYSDSDDNDSANANDDEENKDGNCASHGKDDDAEENDYQTRLPKSVLRKSLSFRNLIILKSD